MNNPLRAFLLLSVALAVACGTDEEHGQDLEPELASTQQALNLPLGRRYHSLVWPTNNYCVSVLDVSLAGPQNGSRVDIGPCKSAAYDSSVAGAGQYWRFDNESRFIELENAGGPWFLDFPNWGRLGEQLHIWGPTDTDAQKWVLANGRLVNSINDSLSGILCLDAAYGNVNSGTPLIFWNCNDSPSQRWWLFGDGTIRPATRWDLCVDVPLGANNNGNWIQLYTCNGQPPQQWRMTSWGLINPGTGKAIDREIAQGGGPGSKAQLWEINQQKQQYFWYLGQIRGNKGYCMDVRNGGTRAGTPVQGWDCLGTDNPNQQFYYFP